jgi:quercetin dioxygenase-like cupin family protein
MNLPELVLGNIFVRRNIGKTGDVVKGHTHNFDHVTYVAAGVIQVVQQRPNQEPRKKVFRAGDVFLVYADTKHEITFLEDGQFHCIYAHRDPQGRVVEHYTGWGDAYI